MKINQSAKIMLMSKTEGLPIGQNDQTESIQEQITSEADLSTARKAARKVWDLGAKGVIPAAVALMVITGIVDSKCGDSNSRNPTPITPPGVTEGLPTETSFNTPVITATAEADTSTPLLVRLQEKISATPANEQEKQSLTGWMEKLNAADPVLQRLENAYNSHTVEVNGEQVPELYAETEKQFADLAENWQIMGYASYKDFIESQIPVISDVRKYQQILSQIDNSPNLTAQQIEIALSGLDNLSFGIDAYIQVNTKHGLIYKILPQEGVSDQDSTFLQNKAHIEEIIKKLPFGNLTVQLYENKNDPNDARNFNGQLMHGQPGVIRIGVNSPPDTAQHEIDGHYPDPSISPSILAFESEDKIISGLILLAKAGNDPSVAKTIEVYNSLTNQKDGHRYNPTGPLTQAEFNYQITKRAVDVLTNPEKEGIFTSEGKPLFDEFLGSSIIDSLTNLQQTDQIRYKTLDVFFADETQNGTFARIAAESPFWAKLLPLIEAKKELFANSLLDYEIENNPEFNGRQVSEYYKLLRNVFAKQILTQGFTENDQTIINLIPQGKLPEYLKLMVRVKQVGLQEQNADAIAWIVNQEDRLTLIKGGSYYFNFANLITAH